MSDLPVPSQFPATIDNRTTPQILAEPCPNMPVTAVASKFFPGPIAPVLCGDLNFIYIPDTVPGGHDAHVGIDIVSPDVPSRNLDVGGNPVLGFPSRIRGAVEDTGRRGGAVYNVAAYNVASDGVTDATQALITVVAAVTADHGGTTLLKKGVGAEIYFPPGTYLITSPIVCTIPIMFRGAGAGISVLLLGTNPVGPSFGEIDIIPTVNRVSPEDSLYVNCGLEGLALVAVNPADTNNGLVMNVNGASNGPLPGARIIDCNFNDLQVAVTMIDTSVFKMSGCHFRSQTATDVVISNPTYPDAGDSCITDCTFDNKLGELAAVRHLSSGGLRIEDCKFNGDTPFGQGPQFHYLNEASAPGTGDLHIIGCGFENFDAAAIAIAPRLGATFSSINIVGNQFAVRNIGTGISLDASRAGSAIRHCVIEANVFGGDDVQATGPYGVRANDTLGAISDVSICGNVFGMTGRPLGIGIEDSVSVSAAISEHGNVYVCTNFNLLATVGAPVSGLTTVGFAVGVAQGLNIGSDASATASVGGGVLPATPVAFINGFLGGIPIRIPYYNA